LALALGGFALIILITSANAFFSMLGLELGILPRAFMMYDLHTLQLALTHLSVALRLVDHIGATAAGAHIDMAIHALRQDVEKKGIASPRSLDSTVDYSRLEAIAIDLVDRAMSEANSKSEA
jgi:hypothetical protein